MLFKYKSRRSRHEYNSKKCRLTLGSSGTFLFDKNKEKNKITTNSTIFYHIQQRSRFSHKKKGLFSS